MTRGPRRRASTGSRRGSPRHRPRCSFRAHRHHRRNGTARRSRSDRGRWRSRGAGTAMPGDHCRCPAPSGRESLRCGSDAHPPHAHCDWERIGQVHGEFFREVRPVTTVMQVGRFIRLVEVEADAVVEE